MFSAGAHSVFRGTKRLLWEVACRTYQHPAVMAMTIPVLRASSAVLPHVRRRAFCTQWLLRTELVYACPVVGLDDR